MKSFTVISFLFFVAHLTLAQSEAQTFAFVSVIKEANTLEKSLHSHAAIDQISKHIAKNIDYPTIVKDYGFEGKMMIDITIGRDGLIEDSKIVKSSNLASIDNAALNTLSSLIKIDTESGSYDGVKMIRIPLNIQL